MEILVLLLVIALAVLIVGAIYYLAERLLPEPWPFVIVGATVLVLLIALASGSADVDLD